MFRKRQLVWLVLFTGSFVHLTHLAAEDAQDAPKNGHLVLLTESPGSLDGVSPVGESVVREHLKYIKGLRADGIIPLAEALFEYDQPTELSGALSFVVASNMREARGVAMKDPLVKDVIVNAPRKAVWQAWTTPQGLQSFFARNVNMELRPGGPFEMLFDHEAEQDLRGSEGCKVLSFVEEEVLSFTWNAPPEFMMERSDHTVVVLQFAEVDGDRTHVTLHHDGWKWKGSRPGQKARWGEVRSYFDDAWDRVLKHLQKRFDKGPRWSKEEIDSVRVEFEELQHFVYLTTPARDDGQDLSTYSDEEKEAFAGHIAHVLKLAARDRLIFAGLARPQVAYPETPAAQPLEIPPVLIFVVKARDLDEARELMEGEPMVARGFWKARVQPFVVAVGVLPLRTSER